MSSPSRSRKGSIEKVRGKCVREDVGDTVAHKIGNKSSTDPDHSCEKVCRGCHRRYVRPKFPHVGILTNPDSPFNAIPGMLIHQFAFVEEMFAKSDDKTILITRITHEIKEHTQLLDLLQPFGEVSSTTLDTGVGGKFAFVTFVNKEDAEKAIDTLNDSGPRGWDNRVLKVYWASNLKKST